MATLRKPKIKHTLVNMGGKQGKIEYIVIHFVGASGQALANANYFYNTYREASAHYFIDAKETYEVVPEGRVAWHVGDGRGKYGITNSNAIGIEGCQDVTTGRNVWEWQFHPNTYEQMILLTVHLMKKYKLGLGRVVRHYDASRKSCPGNWMANNWERWWKFKADVKKAYAGEAPEEKQAEKPEESIAKSSRSNEMYTIKVGDTLSKIAKEFNVTVQDLVKWNNLENPDLIFPETKIIVKPVEVVQVDHEEKAQVIKRKGSFRFNTTVNIRNQPEASGSIPDKYYPNEVVNYDEVHKVSGMLWLEYKSWDGKTRYISAGTEEYPYGTFL